MRQTGHVALTQRDWDWEPAPPSPTANFVLIAIACWSAALVCVAGFVLLAGTNVCQNDTCDSPLSALSRSRYYPPWPALEHAAAECILLLVLAAGLAAVPAYARFGRGPVAYVIAGALFSIVALFVFSLWLHRVAHYAPRGTPVPINEPAPGSQNPARPPPTVFVRPG